MATWHGQTSPLVTKTKKTVSRSLVSDTETGAVTSPSEKRPLRAIVYGGKGWIGTMLCHELSRRGWHINVPPTRVDNVEEVMRDLHFIKPDRVFCVVGRTHGKLKGDSTTELKSGTRSTDVTTIDYLERPEALRENVGDNLFAPVSLAQLCTCAKIHLTYIGTGCIFHFDEAHPMCPDGQGFTEDDQPNFFGSAYSTVKGYTDRLLNMPPYSQTVLNARIRMPISDEPHPRNFVTKLANYSKLVDIPNSVTVLPSLLPRLVDLSEKKVTGTLNLTNPGIISHNQLMQMYQQEVDPSFVIRNFTVKEQAQVLRAGRSNNKLETRRLEALFPVGTIPSAHEACQVAMKRYGETFRAQLDLTK